MIKTLAQWLQHLETIHPREMELGLDRVSTVARQLGLLPVTVPVVTVAGTNGKGSTVAMLESLLRESGASVGAFTSPHFLRFNERIRIDGEDATDAEIVAAFTAIEAARGDVTLTYFEFANLAALWVFRERAVDMVVLEVGLGGRLDAANMVDADVAVITRIDLDHQEWLGDTRGAIAREKAGIMRPGRPVVIADPSPPPELLACAAESGAEPALVLGDAFGYEKPGEHWHATLTQRDGTRRRLPDLPSVALLPANICAAMQAVEWLGVRFTDAMLRQALDKVSATGRCERQTVAGKSYLLDVAHNPSAINNLLENIDATPCKGKVIALFSAMKDKPVAEMVALCAGHFDAWFLGEQPDNPRAMKADDIAGILREQELFRVSLSKNLRQAFRRAQSVMGPEDLLVVFGSFFTVAAVLPQLEKDRVKAVSNE